MATRPSMQKISLAVERIAWDLLCLDVGDRVRSIDEYHTRLGVSSGTVKNALDYLESTGSVAFSRHGHEGTIVEHVDYRSLQRSCTRGQLLGIMPLPYSIRYEGLATALCEQLSDLDFNMAYARGAESRIALVESSTYHFAVTSRYAALRTIEDGHDVAIAVDCGPGSFLSRHVLVFRRGQNEVVEHNQERHRRQTRQLRAAQDPADGRGSPVGNHRRRRVEHGCPQRQPCHAGPVDSRDSSAGLYGRLHLGMSGCEE